MEICCRVETSMQIRDGDGCGWVLEIQGKWAEDSPHHLVILHKMFCHAASEGWKEAEQIIC